MPVRHTAHKLSDHDGDNGVAAAPSPHGGAKGWSSLAGLLTGAGAGASTDVEVEDLERWREEVRATLARIDVKRGRLQGQIAAASRGSRRRAPRRAAPGTAAARVGGHAPPPLPPPADDDDDSASYARNGAVRRRLRAVAGDVKKERQRLEAMWTDLDEAIVDARERLALQPAGRTA